MNGIELENYTLNYIGSLIPKSYELRKFPSIRQCVGTNRLWGARLGQAMCEDLNNEIEEKKLINIAILSRSILVLDDHIDDEHLLDSDTKFLTECVKNLENSLFGILNNIGEDPKLFQKLREKSKLEYQKRNKTNILTDIYRSSINKCLIFFNPYRLSLAQKISNINARLHFLEMFFFACQLLDDYQDLKEDLVKKTNHNIFFFNKSNDERYLIERKHLNWTASLLFQILQNLTRTDVVEGSINSHILSLFHQYSIYYINIMLSEGLGLENINIEKTIQFEDWKFDPMNYVSCTEFNRSFNQYIRPEFMQTYGQGFRNIDLI